MPSKPLILTDTIWSRIATEFERGERFLVTTHTKPDGDGLGAELGLWAYLRSRGKDARIVNPDPIAPRYEFLNGDGQFEVFDPDEHRRLIGSRDVIVFLDFSRWDRLGALREEIRRSEALTICLDHHPVESGPAHLNGIDPTAAATGQLVYELIRTTGHPVTRQMATGFYVSILTDTGGFRFSNSDARAHRVVAELLAHGLDPQDLYERVFGNWSLERLKLLGVAFDNLRVFEDGQIIVLSVTREMISRTGADPGDIDGFVDVARSAGSCECVLLVQELEPDRVRVSLRSKGRVNVHRVASALGGGGHLHASGATVEGALEEVRRQALELLQGEVRMPPEPSDGPVGQGGVS